MSDHTKDSVTDRTKRKCDEEDVDDGGKASLYSQMRSDLNSKVRNAVSESDC